MSQQALKSAKTLFKAYKGALATLEADIGEPFLNALSLIQHSTGRCCAELETRHLKTAHRYQPQAWQVRLYRL